MSFEAIPVIDLMGGQVVRAERGERDRYRPIMSSLCSGSEPLLVAAALLKLHQFSTLYIADLDAIRGLGDHRQTIATLRQVFPHIALWVDAGFSDIDTCHAWQALDIHTVIGSESQTGIDTTLALLRHLGNRAILSLDSLAGDFRGPQALLEHTAEWPERLIAMNLTRVGSHAGPDLDLLHQLQQQHPARKIYAAGGVRHIGDLRTLADKGVAGALVASALHDGVITAGELKAV